MSEPVLVPISHDQFVEDVRAIAAKLANDQWQPDFLIGVGRGGLVPGAYLSHASGMTLLSVDYSSQVFAFADELLRQLATRPGQHRNCQRGDGNVVLLRSSRGFLIGFLNP